ncbi:hypothetical protein CLV84_3405 [Neolewinella xylanilytica]|uniref:Uncharacterized protein n=1 Tax=Neolewinella xylanilytica TaxID=1514080 RepID=A0A2S6I5M6_9BACT|nr:hypothetical protein [Neolewinella xylanilytica]PPK86476.1 hypothetical protein CLV84_3405 [Neolewinella xylanilytica]
MKQLSELVGLLGADHALCTCNLANPSALTTLYAYLQHTEHPCADSAAAQLDLEAGDPAFRKVKHRLKLQLFNALTAIKPTERTADRRERAHAYVWKLIAIAKQLRTSLASSVLLPYLKEAFRIAEQFELVDAAYQCAVMLRRQYANRHFDPEKYAHYAAEAMRYQQISRCYQDVVARFNYVAYLRNTHSTAEEIQEAARSAYLEHRHAIEAYDLALISYIVYLLELNIHLAVHDYEAVIEVANKGLRYLDGKATAQPIMYQVFEANLTVAYTQLNDYERGTDFARRLLEKTDPSAFNYLKVYELLLLLALRAGKFQEAYDSFLTIRPDTLTKNLLSYYNETFRIIEAYLYLLVRMGQIRTHPDDRTFQRFRINRFLNSFQFASGEKNSRNVHLLIIEIINHVLHRRHSKTVYSIEAINKYASRHLKGKSFERIRYFLKALAQLATQQFHRAAVERHTTRYIRMMRRKRIEDTNLDYYLEIVPYEMLWALILDELGYKRIRIRQTGEDRK